MGTAETEIYFDITLSDADRKALKKLVDRDVEILKNAKLWVVVRVKVRRPNDR